MSRFEGSVAITGFIAPTDTSDTYATHDSVLGKGGLREVETLVIRDEISEERRRVGMIVFVIEDGHYYSLVGDTTNLSWRDLGTTLGGTDELSEELQSTKLEVENLTQRVERLEAVRPMYEVSISLTSVFEASEIVFIHIMPYDVNTPGVGVCRATALYPADATFEIKLDGTGIGTIAFTSMQQSGVVNFIEGATINTGSILTIEAPQAVTELADVGVHLTFTIREPE